MGNNNRNLTKKEDQVMELKVNQEVETEAEATEVVKPEDTTVEDAPVKGFKGWVADKKAKHPRFCRGAKKVGMVLGLIAAGMVGKKIGEEIQERKDADLLQDAFDNGDIYRANDEMLKEANQLLEENTDV